MCETVDINFDIWVYKEILTFFFVKTKYTVYLLEVQL